MFGRLNRILVPPESPRPPPSQTPRRHQHRRTLTSTAFYHDKSTVLQEARVFNESPISPRKCRALLTRIVYLLYVGETFSTHEATTLFFGVTKLFQHKDVRWPTHRGQVALHC
jgi:hypothetical protein